MAFGTATLSPSISSVVTVSIDEDGPVSVSKSPRTEERARRLELEARIHAKLKHPLIIGFRGFIPSPVPTIVTQFVANGSLADHLPVGQTGDPSHLSGANRICRIIVGIVLAMRYLHSRGIIHLDLCPENILLDWDWNVRITNFGHSISQFTREEDGIHLDHLALNCRYLAPECYENDIRACDTKADVFSFALILFELVMGEPAFPLDWEPLVVMKRLSIDAFRPQIPASLAQPIRTLIVDCWAQEPRDRPSFDAILNCLKAIDFELSPDITPRKLAEFVNRVEAAAIW
jgi:serine/threonine protein kinase